MSLVGSPLAFVCVTSYCLFTTISFASVAFWHITSTSQTAWPKLLLLSVLLGRGRARLGQLGALGWLWAMSPQLGPEHGWPGSSVSTPSPHSQSGLPAVWRRQTPCMADLRPPTLLEVSIVFRGPQGAGPGSRGGTTQGQVHRDTFAWTASCRRAEGQAREAAVRPPRPEPAWLGLQGGAGSLRAARGPRPLGPEAPGEAARRMRILPAAAKAQPSLARGVGSGATLVRLLPRPALVPSLGIDWPRPEDTQGQGLEKDSGNGELAASACSVMGRPGPEARRWRHQRPDRFLAGKASACRLEMKVSCDLHRILKSCTHLKANALTEARITASRVDKGAVALPPPLPPLLFWGASDSGAAALPSR